MHPMGRGTALSVWSSRVAAAIHLPVKEADFPAEDWTPVWLDNSRVLFRGGTRTDALPPGVSHRHYVWDVVQSTIAREARFDRASMICVQGDRLSYLVPDSEGKQGKRVMFVNGQQIELPEMFWFNSMSCRASTIKPAWAHAKEEGRVVIPLIEDHGYIDCGIKGKGDIEEFPILYHRYSIAQPIPLRLCSRYVPSRVRFLPFLNAYLLESVNGGTSPNLLWLLHTDGKVERIDLPEGGPRLESSWPWIDVTKIGVVLGEVAYRGDQVRESGVSLWANGSLTKLVSGVVSSSVAVSPDGSKLAFIFDRQDRSPQGDKNCKLQMIELCQGDEGGR